MKNFHNDEFRGQIIGCLLTITFILAGLITVFSQSNIGTTNLQGSDTGHKADQNLKSLAKVNPSTLAMEFSIPFMSYPGRNGNSVSAAITYSSKVWRMDTNMVWWYSDGGAHKKFVTDINGVFGEYTAAGWTSNLMAPRLDEKLEIFNQHGKSFNSTLDELFIYSSLNSQLCSTCTHNMRHCKKHNNRNCTEWSEWQCSRYEIFHCSPMSTIEGQAHQSLDTTHYVKRVYVQMPDGSSQEFRKSDAVFGFCTQNGQNNPSNCEGNGEDRVGTYLAVNGSGMKLVRPEANAPDQRTILYLPDGTRYFFPVTTTPLQGIYASESIDADGNKVSYSKETVDNLTIRKVKDTLGREITDPLPHNWDRQEMITGDIPASFPGLNEQTQDYVLKWRRLKPEGCETSTSPTCGIDENGEVPGALENQSEKLYYTFKTLCQGNLTTELSTTEVLFPQWQLGHRLCNPFIYQNVNGTQTEVGVRFNPVVLAEVKLPNNKSYKFRYNRYGEITKIIYPTGSYETFTYNEIPTMGGEFAPIYSQSNRGVTERRVYDAQNTLQQVWKYSAIINGTTATAPYKVTTIASSKNDPNVEGMKTERYLWRSPDPNPNDIYGNFGFEDPRAGMPIDEKTFDENGALRSRTLTEWIVAPPRTGGEPRATRDPRVKRKISVMIEGGQALATLSETEYNETGVTGNNAQSDPEYFSHLNVKRVKAYHYAVVTVSSAQNGSIDDLAAYFNNNLLSNTAETDYQYDANYKARGISSLPTESRVYDSNGNVITKSQTLFDEQSYIDLNGSGTLSSSLSNTWTDPGTLLRGKPTTAKVWDDDNDRWISTHTTFDQYGNPRKVWDAVADPDTPSRFVETFYDDPNNTTCGGQCPQSYAYPTKVITPAPSDGVHGTNLGSQASTTYDYTTGLPLTATNDFGQTMATEYDDPLLRPTRSYAVNFAAPESQTIYDDTALTVKVRKQIDEQNWDEATTFSDSLARPIRTQAKDSQGDIFTETIYDFLGRPVAVTNPYREGDTVYWSKTRYDEMGRAVEAYAPATWHPTNTGESLGITEHGISSQTGFVGTIVTKTDASGRKSRSFTNGLGQLVRVDEPGSNNQLEAVPQTTPSPNPTPAPSPNYPTDPEGCVINCPNNLTGSEYPMHSTYYEYNVQGKMVKVTQGVQTRYFLYDSLGRLIRVRQPEQEVNDALDKSDPATGNGKWTARITYDLFGNVLTTTDAKGVTITNTYDKANRVLTKIFSGEPQGQTTPQVEYFYDGYGLGVTPPTTNNYAKGKLTKVTSSISETRYTKFDSFGRLEEMEQRTPFGSEAVADATARVSKYKYDFGGRLIEETYPSGRVVKNSFEADGDLANIVSKAATQVGFKTFASNFTYTATGLIDKLQIGSGRWEVAKFNERNQVTEMSLGTSPSDTSLWKLNYEYGELESNGTVNTAKNTGNIAKQTISYSGLAQPFVQTYQYDSLYRITEAKEMNGTTQTWNQNWSYDRYGNRIGFAQNLDGNQLTLNQQTLPTVDPNTNRFTDANYHYDKAGNLVNDPKNNGRVFTFNGDNKQTEVRDSSITPSPSNPDANLIGRYYYDGEGKRVKKVTATEITVFVYSSGKLVAEYSTELPQNPTTSYVATDTLQSVRAISDKNGNVISRRDFMPFGEELFANTANRTTGAKYTAAGDDGIRQKFTGYEKDKETGLDFAEARYYNNAHGRFTAVDPLLASGKSANPQTFNRYIYVSNNPIIRTDPFGLDWYKDKNDFRRWSTDGKTFDYAADGQNYAEGATRDVVGESWSKVAGDDFIYEGGGIGIYTVLDPKSTNWKSGFTTKESAQQYLDNVTEKYGTDNNPRIRVVTFESTLFSGAKGEKFSGIPGHVAFGVQNKTYSWDGTGYEHDKETDFQQYLDRNFSYRSGTLFELDFGSPSKNRQAADEISKGPRRPTGWYLYPGGSGYNLVTNNCGETMCRVAERLNLRSPNSIAPWQYQYYIQRNLKPHILNQQRLGPVINRPDRPDPCAGFGSMACK